MTAYGIAAIDSYPWVERYYDDDLSTGNNDGTSPENAWQSLADMAAGLGSMTGAVHVNMKKTASPVTLSGVFSFPGGNLARGPIWYEGYEAAPGDGGVWVGRASGTSYFEVASVGLRLFSSLLFQGDGTESVHIFRCDVGVGPAACYFHSCEFQSTTTANCLYGNEVVMAGCLIRNTSTFGTSNSSALVGFQGVAVGNYCQSDGVVVDCNVGPEAQICLFAGNVVISDSSEARDCMQLTIGTETGPTLVTENSFYGGLRGINVDGLPTTLECPVLISHNIFSQCDTGLSLTDTEDNVPLIGNAAGDNTTADYAGLGDYAALNVGAVTLTANPYDDADLNLNDTAGGGAACRNAGAIGFLGGTGEELVTGAFDIGGVRHGAFDGLSMAQVPKLVASNNVGGAGIPGTYIGILPITKTEEII